MTKLAIAARTCLALVAVICVTQLSARSQNQKVTLKVNGQSLQHLFREIKKQTGLVVFYSDALLNDQEKITITAKDETLSSVMEKVVAGRPLRFEIQDKYIVISAKEEKKEPQPLSQGSVPGILPIPPPPIDVTIIVTGDNAQPLDQASVMVKGTTNGGATDVNGRVILKGLSGNETLVISFTGYNQQEVMVKGRSAISIKLEISTNQLDDFQVIAYGKTTKRLQTGNVTTVKSVDIERQPINNPLQALLGRVPGLLIAQQSGLPGSAVSVTIQGRNSIANGSEPFYVIDGVPYEPNMLPGISTIPSLSQGSALSFLNPATIESIEVLRDADATAIYGSRAANGAILITTKKGKAGTSKVDLRIASGWGKINRMQKLLNTEQYLMIRKEAYTNDGLAIPTPSIPDAQKTSANYDLTVWDQNRYTDWQKELIGRAALYTDIQASISGGSASTQFLFGVGYHRETSISTRDLADNRKSVQLNLKHSSPNKKFQFQFTGNYMDDNNRLVNADLTSLAGRLAPNAPALYNADGSLNFEPLNGISTFDNPMAIFERTYDYNTQNLIANSILSYQILPGLDLRSSFGYTKILSDEKTKNPMSAVRPESRATYQRSSRYSDKSVTNWIVEPNLTYKKSFGSSSLDVIFGSTFQRNKSYLTAFDATGFSTDEQMDNIRAAPAVTVTNAILSEYNYSAIFGRINYAFDRKYILNLSGRRDGSSRFGSENSFQNFYAIGGAWIFSDEKWMQKNAPWLSFGKLRVTYGMTGNDQIGDYRFLTLYNAVSAGVPYQGAVGLAPANHANPYLQWEQTNKLNFGLDLGLLKDRISINANYFRNRSSNQLIQLALPLTTGFNNVVVNFPALVQNTGLELGIETKNIVSKNFNWVSNFTLTVPKNRLVSFGGLDPSMYNGIGTLIIGQPLGVYKRSRFAGVDPATGLYQFLTAQGNLTSTPSSADAVSFIDYNPRFYGGIQNTLTYKGFELDLFVQFADQRGYSAQGIYGDRPGTAFNQPAFILKRWQKPGDQSPVGKVTTLTNATLQRVTGSSDAVYGTATYVRLRNASLSWQVPQKWLSAAKLQSGRIFLQGQNLLSLSDFAGDPETRAINEVPTLRIITAGLQVGF